MSRIEHCARIGNIVPYLSPKKRRAPNDRNQACLQAGQYLALPGAAVASELIAARE